MATYGEGDPTDNAQEFYEWLREDGRDLNNLHYAVIFERYFRKKNTRTHLVLFRFQRYLVLEIKPMNIIMLWENLSIND